MRVSTFYHNYESHSLLLGFCLIRIVFSLLACYWWMVMISLKEHKGTWKGPRPPSKEATTGVLTKAPAVYYCNYWDCCSVRFTVLPEETRSHSSELILWRMRSHCSYVVSVGYWLHFLTVCFTWESNDAPGWFMTCYSVERLCVWILVWNENRCSFGK